VSENSAAELNFATLAAERLRLAAMERERLLKRLGAAAAVVLVHILIVITLLTAGRFGIFHEKKEHEVMLLLPPPPQSRTNVRPVVPVIPFVTPNVEEVPRSTITVPAPKTQEKTQGDILEALGKELACGAGPYEHLTQREREACKRQPWKFKKNAKGVIVLDTLLGKQQPQQEEPVSGADENLDIQRTSDPCLAAGNTHTECIHKTIFGR